MARFIVAMSLLLLAGPVSAQRDVVLVENAIETTLGNVTMPNGPAGTVIIYPDCDGCEPRSLRASTDIRFLIGSSSLSHPEFMKEVDRLRGTENGSDAFVGVFFSRNSGDVTRIQVTASNE